MNNFLYVITVLSIVGIVLNIKKRRESFIIWACTNASWGYVDYKAGIYSQAVLFSIYFGLAIWGIVSWSKK